MLGRKIFGQVDQGFVRLSTSCWWGSGTVLLLACRWHWPAFFSHGLPPLLFCTQVSHCWLWTYNMPIIGQGSSVNWGFGTGWTGQWTGKISGTASPQRTYLSPSQWSQYQQSIFRRRFRTSTSHLPCLWCQVMVTSNLWTEASLVNGAVGTVQAICYLSGGLPSLPVAVMVKFDKCRVQLCMMEVFQLSISDVLGYKVVVHVHGCRSPSNLLRWSRYTKLRGLLWIK